MRYLALSLLVGCGGAADYTCQIPCIGEVQSEFRIDCSDVRKNLELAQRILVRRNLVPASRVCSDFSAVHLQIMSASQWIENLGPEGDVYVIGLYDPYGDVTRIKINSDGDSLPHEMLHHWQWIGGIPVFDHRDWRELGYFAADDEYHSLKINLAHRLIN